jgi:hypothetical protein
LARLIALTPFFIALAACSNMSQNLDVQQVATVHRIALIPPHGPDQYLVGSNRSASSITGNASLLGDIVNATQASNSTNTRFNAEVAAVKPSLADDLGIAIKTALQQDGYVVVPAALAPDQPGTLHKDFSALNGQADAALEVAIVDAGYAYSTGHPYEPSIDIIVQLTDLRTQKLLFRKTYSYSHYKPQNMNTDDMITPAAGYEFRGGGELLKDPNRAVAGLKSSVAPIATLIGTALKHS